MSIMSTDTTLPFEYLAFIHLNNMYKALILLNSSRDALIYAARLDVVKQGRSGKGTMRKRFPPQKPRS